jgi:hypothetical protein
MMEAYTCQGLNHLGQVVYKAKWQRMEKRPLKQILKRRIKGKPK